jgi:hypothetical protein
MTEISIYQMINLVLIRILFVYAELKGPKADGIA